MAFVDIHAHLDHPWLAKDLPEVIERAKKAGVAAILTAGIDRESNRKTLELQKRYPLVKAALGIYPPSALRKEMEQAKETFIDYDIEEEIEFIKKNKDKIMAIGEVGMDFAQTDDYTEQEKLFNQMIDLAASLHKPLIVHSRKAEEKVIKVL